MQPNIKIHEINGNHLGIMLLAYCLFLGALVMACTGCGPSVATVKQQIASELGEIAEYQDCPTTCEALKLYIKTKLGGL